VTGSVSGAGKGIGRDERRAGTDRYGGDLVRHFRWSFLEVPISFDWLMFQPSDWALKNHAGSSQDWLKNFGA
jgi:hypothetical protein